MKVLAGDIGGTNARLAIVDITGEGARVLNVRRFASADFPGLAAVVRSFRTELASVPSRACFAIPCPIVDGRCVGTNLSWTIDAHTLAEETGIPHVTLINDLHAVGEAVHRLAPDDIVALQTGNPTRHGVKAIIAAGTGLGQAFLTWTGTGYAVHDSEGGHASFSARNADERALLQTLAERFGHVSRERVISGPGLINIYRHLAARGAEAERAALQVEMSQEDAAAVIGRHALARSDALSMRALDMFLSAYGAQAGNLALTVMAQGGIYVAGGIAPQIIPVLLDGTFMNAFLEKGRLSPFLARVPVHVIVNPHVGLVGAASVAVRNARNEKRQSRPRPGATCGA